jgi:hypothetical protein
MADKKVGRYGGTRTLSPTQKMDAALSDSGTMDVADASHAKAKSTLADKFRTREEKWRRDQSFHDQNEHTKEVEPSHENHEQEEEVDTEPAPCNERPKGGAL